MLFVGINETNFYDVNPIFEETNAINQMYVKTVAPFTNMV